MKQCGKRYVTKQHPSYLCPSLICRKGSLKVWRNPLLNWMSSSKPMWHSCVTCPHVVPSLACTIRIHPNLETYSTPILLVIKHHIRVHLWLVLMRFWCLYENSLKLRMLSRDVATDVFVLVLYDLEQEKGSAQVLVGIPVMVGFRGKSLPMKSVRKLCEWCVKVLREKGLKIFTRGFDGQMAT